ncbi:hypothetical protein J132_03778 [Termitomyces sp. J132]|nr:hypothetical protein J132_03778 [Termitomyces sp. J132]
MADPYWKIPMPHSTQVSLRISTCPVTGPLTPTRHSTPPLSAREYSQAGTALPHSMPMAIIPVSTPEDTPQHPPTPPTFLPPITMCIQSPLQPQSLRSPWITIPPPCPPFAAQTRVKAYAQQRDEVLHFLCLSPAEFARHTHTLLTNLGYPDASATPEVWADRLLDFYKHYLQGNLPENTQGTLGIDNNLQNELRTLVEEIHTSPNPCSFKDPLDPTRSFHMQCKEPIGTRSEAPSSVPHQQKELNVASSILRNLNPAGGLFDQPAAHTLALSAQPRASSVPSAFQTWDQPTTPKLHSQ